jgi:hypothetical protein
LERFHERNAGILTTTAAIGPPFIFGFRLQCDSKPLDTYRIAGFIESHSCNTNTRVISFRDQPRKEVELAIRAASSGRIQNAFDLLWVTRLRFHQHADAL